MNVLRTIESKIEGVFEGVFGRAFRTHVQPVELARKLAKEMDEHRSVSVSRVYVPNDYTVYLSTVDRHQFASYEGSLVGELQEYLTEHAKRERYALLTPPHVTMETDTDLAIGEFGIAARVRQPNDLVPALPGLSRSAARAGGPVAPSGPPPQQEPAPTMIYRAAGPPQEDDAPPPSVERQLVTITVAGVVHPVTSARVVLGRSRECDVTLADSNVSRRHAELVQEGATYWLVDLGSTNGTLLNGRRITREKLQPGDRITIGSTEAVFDRSSP